MSITAKLAYNQLRINRGRTAGALTAIALAAALITAVCGFIASGNLLLVRLLGPSYGEYGGAYRQMLLIPGVLFAVLILAMAVIVISNVFRASTAERVSQFGVLKCVGATKKQITASVLHESVMLSAVGIPLGLALGLLLTFLGVRVANHFLSDLNSLVDVMVVDLDLTLTFVLSPAALALSAAICLFTVVFSAWMPAHKAARVSAVDCIRGTGEVELEERQVRTSPLISRVFGAEGMLAAKNLRRNRRNFRASVIALSAGVVLFIALGTLSRQAKGIQDYMRPTVEQTVMAEYSSSQDYIAKNASGNEETVAVCPIDSALGNTLKEKLEEFDGKDIWGMGMDLDTWRVTLPAEAVTEAMRQVRAARGETQAASEYTFPVEIVTVDDEHYAGLCRAAGAPLGSVLLLDHYSYNNNGRMEHLVPLAGSLRHITLQKADGSTRDVEIGGVLTRQQMPKELFYPAAQPVRLVLPRAEMRAYSWYADPDDVPGFIAYANEVLDEAFPQDEDADYWQADFSTRVYKMDDYMKVMNIAIVLATVFMYGFVALLLLIGFTNVISTLSTNVMMRAREFAVLQSIGMTPEGIRKMLNLESILCAGRALLYGLPLGLLLSYAINVPVRAAFPVPYTFPWAAVLLCTAAVFACTWSTTRFAANKLRHQNIIETIRSNNGR